MPAERLAAAALAAAVLLGGCHQRAPAPAPRESTAPARPQPTATVDIPSRSRDPKAVLIAWAQAVSLREWIVARAYWGDHGSESGLEPADFIARWDVLKDPVVDIGEGREEGAAGSLFYTAPVAIHDGKRTIRGEVVLRRSYEVPGATPEQLRWHVESTTLRP